MSRFFTGGMSPTSSATNGPSVRGNKFHFTGNQTISKIYAYTLANAASGGWAAGQVVTCKILDSTGTTTLASGTFTATGTAGEAFATVSFSAASGTTYIVAVDDTTGTDFREAKTTGSFASASTSGAMTFEASGGFGAGVPDATASWAVDVEYTAAGGGTNYTANITDSAAATDTSSPQVLTTTVSFTDSAGGTDSITAVISSGGTNYTPSPADTAAGADTATTTLSLSRTVTDLAGGADTATTAVTYNRTITDLADGTDTAAGVITGAGAYTGTPTDVAGGTDTVSLTVNFSRQVDDVAAGTDSVSAVIIAPVNYTVTVIDSASGFDSVSVSVQARTYLYTPPTVQRVQRMAGALTYHIPVSTTTFKLNGTWGSVQNPGEGSLDGATYVINRPTIVSAQLAAEILASGVGGTFS